MVVAGKDADGLPVQEHLRAVADLADLEHARPGEVDIGLVQGETLILTEVVGGD